MKIISKDNLKSNVTGVTWVKSCNKWGARITVDKKQIYLGYYDEFDEAVEARKNAEKLYLGKWKARTKYSYNKHYFDEIDTEEKAYWLGYIWSDCNVGKDGMHLKSIDKEHLEKFKKAIDGDMPIKQYKNKGYKMNSVYYQISIYDKKLVKLLSEKYKIIPYRRDDGETVTKTVPQIYSRDFIRGIIDANGSIVTSTLYNSGVNLSIMERLFILKYCNEHFNIILKKKRIEKYTKRHPGRDSNVYNLNITGNRQVFYILDNLYNNSCVYLDRKYNKYMELYTYYQEMIRIDIETILGSGSEVKKKIILEMRDYFNKREEL